MGKSGHINKKEPEGPKVMEAYKNNIHVFNQASWYMYCVKLDGYHYGVAQAFAKAFDGQRVQIANKIMQVTEESIATAYNLLVDGEKWFKNKLITGGDVNQFLKLEHKDPNWAKGIPRDWIVDEWMEALLMLKR
jgi:hypothetical protein